MGSVRGRKSFPLCATYKIINNPCQKLSSPLMLLCPIDQPIRERRKLWEFAKCKKRIKTPPPTIKKEDGGIVLLKNWKGTTLNPIGHPAAVEVSR
jgi:hypothetical protein